MKKTLKDILPYLCTIIVAFSITLLLSRTFTIKKFLIATFVTIVICLCFYIPKRLHQK